MKTERISLIILAFEIVAITMLHSVKIVPVKKETEVAKKTTRTLYPIHPHLTFIEFK